MGRTGRAGRGQCDKIRDQGGAEGKPFLNRAADGDPSADERGPAVRPVIQAHHPRRPLTGMIGGHRRHAGHQGRCPPQQVRLVAMGMKKRRTIRAAQPPDQRQQAPVQAFPRDAFGPEPRTERMRAMIGQKNHAHPVTGLGKAGGQFRDMAFDATDPAAVQQKPRQRRLARCPVRHHRCVRIAEKDGKRPVIGPAPGPLARVRIA